MNIFNSYLWLVGKHISNLHTSQLIKNRYKVINNRLCQDTKPEQLPFLSNQIPNSIAPYFKLFAYNLHLPIVYDFLIIENEEIIILDNVPIDKNGKLYPCLNDVWQEAEPLQQLYWLWQILELWQPLTRKKVAKSLLIPENLRVDNWRIRLLELVPNQKTSLKQLGDSWQNLAISASTKISSKLEFIVSELQKATYPLNIIQEIFNELLLKQATEKPLRTKITSATAKGHQPTNNEDYYYPTELDLYVAPINHLQNLAHNIMIICDGMGGHEGGEIASHLGVESLKIQLKMFLAEFIKTYEIINPEIIKQELAAIIRVTNNLIYSRNKLEGKKDKSIMGTTLVMALQLPQIAIKGNTHEVYLVNIGDSRAYWLTLNNCQQLTVDDDCTTREILLVKKTYRQALQQPFSNKLTQALGVKDGEHLYPNIQRFILVEDGVLLLCSDGLSDNDFLEQNWHNFIPQVLRGEVSLKETIISLLQLAIEINVHDNITIVATLYGVSPQDSVVVNMGDLETINSINDIPDASSLVLAASSQIQEKSKIWEEKLVEEVVVTKSNIFPWKWLLLTLVALVFGISSYLITWKSQPQFNPSPSYESLPNKG